MNVFNPHSNKSDVAPVPPLGISLHQWCALIPASRFLPSGSETAWPCIDQAELLLSAGLTAAEQSEL